MDARIEDFCCKRKTNRYTMLMLYLITDVCINSAYLLMSYNQSYQKIMKRFMKELSALPAKQYIEAMYQNPKIYPQTRDAFIRCGLTPKTGTAERSVIKRRNPS
ncbi:hypothetical protein T10_6871 [Trichinella papuae]|uniref:PiggyBac transposable element-derived protein domain-containing protein n=1 Tax=Trichinella papuae TaxID=268474 RepID=A0A0V1M340_9BILA|nr:hypothetical protein T10_4932 [Trichinella papuae]KRZ66269.1 hypothetical protein T10_8917 [Trichinella papuae]KRZ67758.1 hypothetical protein T10_3048 [Trichinella papuae]KRZ67786.1 hypothetical protein T10_6871 [Trichinella papuae]